MVASRVVSPKVKSHLGGDVSLFKRNGGHGWRKGVRDEVNYVKGGMGTRQNTCE